MRERGRLAFALLVSLLIHALLLNLKFGGLGLGIFPFGVPWGDRQIELPDLRLVLIPPHETEASAVNASVAEPLREAAIEHPVASAPAPVPSVAFRALPRPKPVAIEPASPPTAEAKSRPSSATGANAATAPLRADKSAEATPRVSDLPVSDAASSDGAASDSPTATPVLAPAIAAAPTPSSPESGTSVFRDTPDVAQETARLAVDQPDAERQELARQEAARAEAARREAERQEAERREAERREAERREAERQDAERLSAAQAEEQRQRVAREEEAARVEAARREAERQDAERRAAAELAAQREKAEREEEAPRVEAARQDAERQEAQRREAERLETERREAERLETQRLETERREAERREAEGREAERREAERREAERREAERREAERREAERREAERPAAAQTDTPRQETARPPAGSPDSARPRADPEEEKREARLRAIGRQLDEEARQREQASGDARRPSTLPLSLSTARRVRLWGRAHPNGELIRYSEAWEQKIQSNTPVDTVRQLAKQLRTAPMVTVAIRSDGSVESVSFVLSSGVAEVDEAIRRIVRSLEHYQPFPPEVARDYDVIEIRRTWHFDVAVRLY